MFGFWYWLMTALNQQKIEVAEEDHQLSKL